MKNIILVHCCDGSPKEPMHQWIKKKAESLVYHAVVPEMPNPALPEINAWVSHLTKIAGRIDEETIFIGHSIGCQAVLRYMETLPKNVKIDRCILIAPWMKLDEETIKEEGEEVVAIAKPWMETPINWEKVKSHCRDFICIFSDNDPYVLLANKDIFRVELNAKAIVLKNRYHFDFGNNINNLPEILQFI